MSDKDVTAYTRGFVEEIVREFARKVTVNINTKLYVA